MKQGLIFLAGIGIGGVVGWFASKKYYERRLDAELEEMKEYYVSRENEEEIIESNTPKLPEKPSLDEIRRKYTSSDEIPFEIQPDEVDEDEDIDGYSKEEWDSVGYEQEEDEKRRSNLEIKEIDVDNYGDLPNFDASELIYHVYDDILEDEDGNEIADRNILIGDVLDDIDGRENPETDIFVRNFRFATDYHIHING